MTALAIAAFFIALGLASVLVLADCWLKARAVIAGVAMSAPRMVMVSEMPLGRLRTPPRRPLTAAARLPQQRRCDRHQLRGAA